MLLDVTFYGSTELANHDPICVFCQSAIDCGIVGRQSEGVTRVFQISPDELLVPLLEAISRFGLIKPEAAEWLATALAPFVNRSQGRDVRESGTRLTKDERLQLGLDRWGDHLSWEVWNALTEKGRRNPASAFDESCSWAVKTVRDGRFRERTARVQGLFVGFRITTIPGRSCEAAENLAGAVQPDQPAFPLPGCTNIRCSCSSRGMLPGKQ
jgi:hypothetical protein